MEYKVIGIVPVLDEKQNINDLAKQFEDMIKKHTTDGWEYVRTESLKTWVNGNKGCFGFGATPGFYAEKQLMIFRK